MMALALGAVSGNADLLFYEGFDYAPGLLGGNVHPDGDTWSSTAWYWVIQSPGLTYPGLVTTGNTTENIGNSHQTRGGETLSNVAGITTMFTAGGTYYYTYLISDSSVITLWPGKHFGYVLNTSPSPWQAWTYIDNQNKGGDYETGRLHGNPGADNNGHGGTHMYAWRIINNAGGDDQIDLVIDPDLSLGEPDWNALTVARFAGVEITYTEPNAVYIGGANLAAFPEEWGYPQGGNDEIRIATTWDEAVSGTHAPAPATLGILALGGGLALLRRRVRVS